MTDLIVPRRESNSHSFALTPHPCTDNAYHVCEKDGCGGTYSEDRFAGKCDANGCDYNPYRMGNKDFYGKGKTVDTSKKFTLVPRSILTLSHCDWALLAIANIILTRSI